MTLFQSHEVVEIEPSESVYDGDIPLSRFNSEYNGHDNGEMFDSIHSQALGSIQNCNTTSGPL